MEKQILLNGINLNQLLEEFGKLIDSRLDKKLTQQSIKDQTEFITRKEVSSILKISLPTLHEWTKSGLIQSYKIRSRVLYKLDEIQTKISELATYKFKKGGYHAA